VCVRERKRGEERREELRRGQDTYYRVSVFNFLLPILDITNSLIFL
jgi:hypothetical protein